MLNTLEDYILVILIVALSMSLVLAINYFWPANLRRVNNDIIGWQLGILGTTYAVIVGFMLYTVWTNFGIAAANANMEASSLLNVYRLAQGFPEPQRDQLQSAARLYADTVVNSDWPMMEHTLEGHLKSRQIIVDMWQIMLSMKGGTPNEVLAEDHALSELAAVASYRKLRQNQSSTKLPKVLWYVLIIGALLTIVSSCLLGSDNRWLHGQQVFALSLLIALVLVAIADIDRPFQGSVHVSKSPFARAQQNMQEE
jgi:hypothetical protein